MLWDEFDDAWGADDEEWVDPAEERENREYAIVSMWQQGILDTLTQSGSTPEAFAARRLIAEAKRITGRQSPPEGDWEPTPRIQWLAAGSVRLQGRGGLDERRAGLPGSRQG